MLETAFLPPLPAAAPGGLPWSDGLPAGVAPTTGPEAPASPFALLLEAQVPKAEPAATERTESASTTDGATAPADQAPPPGGADPALLAQLALAVPPPAPAKAVPSSPEAGTAGGTDPVDAAASGTRRRPLPVKLAAEQAPAATARPDTPAQPAAPQDPSALAAQLAMVSTPSRERVATPRVAAPRDDTPGVALAGLGAHAAPALREAQAVATAAPAHASVAAPVDSPEFAAELAARVSVLARDGVQRAELRLHPVELGPVAVQIAIEGTQARVDFGAEMSATRSAIEASLPALAASLRDAGLTLSGGGVSQQMPGQAQHPPASSDDGSGPRRPGGGRASDEPVVSAVTPLRRHLRAGGVDLYA
jgi:flagellar hook-length control protein FliK